MKSNLIIIFTASALLLAACTSTSAPARENEIIEEGVTINGGTYNDISVHELAAMMEDKDFTLINVHIPFAGNIFNTDLSIPYNVIGVNPDQRLGDKDAKIVLYCRSGSMSSSAANTLVNLGYTNVWNVEGGFRAWKVAGYPMEDIH